MRILVLSLLLALPALSAPRMLDGLVFMGPYAADEVIGPPKPVNIPIPAAEPVSGVAVTCSPGPEAMNGNLPKGVVRWTCGVANHTAETRSVNEAMVVTALLSAGVGAVPTTSVVSHAGERVRLSGWKRLSRYMTQLALPLVLAAATDVIILTPTETRVLAGLAVGLPRLADLVAERGEVLPVPVWTEAVTLEPGAYILRQAYSSEWEGRTPIEAVIP